MGSIPRKIWIIALLSLLAGMGITALVILIGSGGWNTLTWLLTSLITSLGFFALALAVRWAGGGRALNWIVLSGLALRLLLGIGLTLALPVIGYDNEEHNAGYIFADSYDRDQQAWSLAASGKPVISAFENEYLSDQYGGLLTLLALQYRYASPDAHRQMLPLLISALIFMLAVPFLWKGLSNRWNPRVALIACLVFTFYPESVLLSSAHMREPYLVCLASIATWAVLAWQKNKRRSAIILAGSIAGLMLISWRSGVVITGILLVWLFLDAVMDGWPSSRQIWGWLLIIAGVLLTSLLSYRWIRETAVFDTYNTVQSSGILQYIFHVISDRYYLPVVTAFGLTQPLLPAALVALSNPLASGIAILRSLGWYLLAPVLIFGFFAAWKAKPGRDRRLLIWLTSITLIWIVVSSYRAGGDIWDNPRYRTILLPWLALVAGWTLDWVIAHKNPWLWRFYLIEFIFILVFTNFYLTRYAHIGLDLNLFLEMGLVLAGAAVVIGVGIYLDRRKRREIP